MRQARVLLTVETGGGDLTEVTDRIARWLGQQGLSDPEPL